MKVTQVSIKLADRVDEVKNNAQLDFQGNL